MLVVPPSARLRRSRRLAHEPMVLAAILVCAACGNEDAGATTGADDAAADRGGAGGANEGGGPDAPAMGAGDAGEEADTASADVTRDVDSSGPDATIDTTDAGVEASLSDRADEPSVDARLEADVFSTADTSVADAPVQVGQHVHVTISNTCVVGASPPSFSVPRGQTLRLSWHNHSVDYDADVWLSYGGGFLGLKAGDVWDDRFDFCTGPRPYMAYGDVGIAGGGGSVCPSFRVRITCE